MPTYPYACTSCDHSFEQVQSFTEDSLTVCPECGGRLRKVFGSVGVVFKGSGFYRTDSRASGPAGTGAKESSAKDGGSKDGGSKGGGSKDGGSKDGASAGSGAKAASSKESSPSSTKGSSASGSSSPAKPTSGASSAA